MSIYSYDHVILARSREIIRRSFELLRWSEPYVRRGNNHIGESVQPEDGARCADAANDRRSSEEGG